MLSGGKYFPDMRQLYHRICAYSAHWIPAETGTDSIDHFLPKTSYPALAYEWSNYRYVSLRFNQRKGVHAILDPFTLEPNWFLLDFASFLVQPSPVLLPEQEMTVNDTIRILMLNSDEDLVESRRAWVECYQEGQCTFGFLARRAPFIAYELKRQGLVAESE